MEIEEGITGGRVDVGNVSRVAADGDVRASVESDLVGHQTTLGTDVELVEAVCSEDVVHNAGVGRVRQEPRADVAAEAVRVVLDALTEAERHGAVRKGPIGDAATSAPAGDDEGKVGEGRGLSVRDVRAIAAEALGGMEDG